MCVCNTNNEKPVVVCVSAEYTNVWWGGEEREESARLRSLTYCCRRRLCVRNAAREKDPTLRPGILKGVLKIYEFFFLGYFCQFSRFIRLLLLLCIFERNKRKRR